MAEALEAVCPVSSLILMSPLSLVPTPAEALPGLDSFDEARLTPAHRSPLPLLAPTQDNTAVDQPTAPLARTEAPSFSWKSPAEAVEFQFEIRVSLPADSLVGSPLIVLATFPAVSHESIADSSQPMAPTGVASDASPSSTTSPTPVVGSSANASTPATANADGIRPMALAPGSLQGSSEPMLMSGGSGGSGGSARRGPPSTSRE